mmetsp:Transcript_59069/g.121047  ORF Transcript_59069/g.121047 Transcript_59069/m.121047 type:complete len:87 (-) Transcript_59069:298-558(-)
MMDMLVELQGKAPDVVSALMFPAFLGNTEPALKVLAATHLGYDGSGEADFDPTADWNIFRQEVRKALDYLNVQAKVVKPPVRVILS